MYSTSINCIFSTDDSENMELEVSIRDSDGKDFSAYAASDDITTLLNDIVDQFDEAIAEAEKEPELTEVEQLTQRINELTNQLNDMATRNQYLENAIAKAYEEQTARNNEPLKKYDNSINITNMKKNYSSLLDKIDRFENTYHNIP